MTLSAHGHCRRLEQLAPPTAAAFTLASSIRGSISRIHASPDVPSLGPPTARSTRRGTALTVPDSLPARGYKASPDSASHRMRQSEATESSGQTGLQPRAACAQQYTLPYATAAGFLCWLPDSRRQGLCLKMRPWG